MSEHDNEWETEGSGDGYEFGWLKLRPNECPAIGDAIDFPRRRIMYITEIRTVVEGGVRNRYADGYVVPK